MAGNNQVAKQEKTKFSLVMQSDQIQSLIHKTLTDSKKASRFIASISAVVATNPALQECDVNTVINGALVGEALDLAPSPQLGHYYLVPFNDNVNNRKVATFILGYKGYIQLAIRSGQYKRINVIAVKEGELIKWNPLTEEIQLKLIDDMEPTAEGVYRSRDEAKTIGYFATFEYLNGFVKSIYWSYSHMLKHADKYSPAFNAQAYANLIAGKIPQKDQWKYSSFWYKNFDDMAFKTMLRQLISRWGIMSIEMINAYEADSTYQEEQGIFKMTETVGETINQASNEVLENTGSQEPPKTQPEPQNEPVSDPVEKQEQTQADPDAKEPKAKQGSLFEKKF